MTSQADVEEVGTVIQIGDGIARIYGLDRCVALEKLELDHGVTGLALNLEEDNVAAVLFGEWDKIKEGDTVRRTGRGHVDPRRRRDDRPGRRPARASRSTADRRSRARRRGRWSSRPPASSTASR